MFVLQFLKFRSATIDDYFVAIRNCSTTFSSLFATVQRLFRRYSRLFNDYSSLFATIRDCSSLFATIRDHPSLFAIRVFQTPLEIRLKEGGIKSRFDFKPIVKIQEKGGRPVKVAKVKSLRVEQVELKVTRLNRGAPKSEVTSRHTNKLMIYIELNQTKSRSLIKSLPFERANVSYAGAISETHSRV